MGEAEKWAGVDIAGLCEKGLRMVGRSNVYRLTVFLLDIRLYAMKDGGRTADIA